MGPLNQEQGTQIVRYARKVIESYFLSVTPRIPEELREPFSKKMGVFVTLHKSKRLRGCIGYPEPVARLEEAVTESALSAALHDPRFPQVQKDELDLIDIEVSVLTNPIPVEVANPLDYAKNIVVGRDGLIAELGRNRGLLLPQVPVELGWESQQYLEQTCNKAGLPTNAYMKPGFKLYLFQAQIFAELNPKGEVVERTITSV